VRHAVVVLGAALAVACAAPPPAQEPAPRPAAEPATPTRAFLPPVTSRPPPEVELEIEFPPEGGVVAEGGMAYVAGRTRSRQARNARSFWQAGAPQYQASCPCAQRSTL